MQGKKYVAADWATVRVALLPTARAEATRIPLADDPVVRERQLSDYLRGIADDPWLREAIEVSSPPLAELLDRVRAGTPLPPKRLERAVHAATGYVLRSATRPTPFGLLAGVLRSGFGDRAQVTLGQAHAKAVSADRAWLWAYTDENIGVPEVYRNMRVQFNNLCFRRGERIVLPWVASGSRTEFEKNHGRRREVTLRATPLIDQVAALANAPLGFAELTAEVVRRFPQLTAARTESFLLTLVRQDFLVCDVRPVQNTLVAERSPVSDRLRELDRALSDYEAKPIGDGAAQWRSAREAMRAASPSQEPAIAVHLTVDARITLPGSVREEAEAAAGLLRALATPSAGPEHLREYHRAFIDRYGTDRTIPLLTLLDPHAGLDAPAGYRSPPSSRHLSDPLLESTPTGAADLESSRELYLGALMQAALRKGAGEVVLTDDDVERLAHPDTPDPTDSLDLCFEVIARNEAALDSGDYLLALSPFSGSNRAGAMTGRFAHQLHAEADLRALVTQSGAEGALHAQVFFQPSEPRSLNVSSVPRLLEHVIPVGVIAEGEDTGVIDPRGLAVGATSDRLVLVRASDGREVVPVVPHVLHLSGRAPNVVRFLAEIGASGQQQFRSWDWGRRLKTLPYLPRIRRGRTILAPARWRPPADLLEAPVPWPEWCARLARWREECRVPDSIHIAVGDRRLALDLTADLHRRILRRELDRSPQAVVFESLADLRDGTGWLGGHACEVTLPLRGSARQATVSLPVGDPAVREPEPALHLPGGNWLYAKLYALEEVHDSLLTGDLRSLLDEVGDRLDQWFFIRYRDPEPHIRLRLHGAARELNTVVLPALGRWSEAALRSRSIRGMTLDTYVPEEARYGGAKALRLAEELFAADSRCTMAQLRLGSLTALPREVLAAMNMASILRAWGSGGAEQDWEEWALQSLPARSVSRLSREEKALLPAICAPERLLPDEGTPHGRELLTSWHAREAAAAAYGRHLERSRSSCPLTGRELPSTLHMHANRLLGVDRRAEDRSYFLLRSAVHSAGRRRGGA
ncbi:lantibiotic dehydratase [Kitasatospora sp. NPDC093550]|uniref:lantibiotic dehydratase n=1 Tax=Kitasatospora sp. NPDC093550 TaxID=3364089 RepID=UPI0038262CC9